MPELVPFDINSLLIKIFFNPLHIRIHPFTFLVFGLGSSKLVLFSEAIPSEEGLMLKGKVEKTVLYVQSFYTMILFETAFDVPCTVL